MKILVTGGSGQLGLALQRQSSDHHLIAFDRTALDITDAVQVAKVFMREQPDAVINCAAWTNVDACEGDPEKAMLINGATVAVLATGARTVGAQLVQISTDYVFDGTKQAPYVETDRPNPVSAYGKSKLLGEESAGPDALIVRTSWVVGPDGHNMLKTILRLLQGPDDLHFVDDQVGYPTFTDDLALTIISLLEREAQGIFHVTNADAVSWFHFAQEIAQEIGADPKTVKPTTSADLDPPRAAPRPMNSHLDNAALRDFGVEALSSHQVALQRVLALTANKI